jgi:DNA topoisomerase-1
MLIRTLEENGIGRPSTFAGIVSTIERRVYVEREGTRFKPTMLGIVVSDYLVQWIPDIMDTGFTASMEEKLDEVSRGDIEWIPMLREFYGPFDEMCSEAQENSERVPRSLLERPTGEMCPTCAEEGNESPLVIRIGRNGEFIGCSTFPACKHTSNIRVETGVKCPETGGELLERKKQGRNRPFYGCEHYPDCKFTTNDRPLKEPCPECGGLLVARGRNGAKCVTTEDYDGPAPEAVSDGESEGASVSVVA